MIREIKDFSAAVDGYISGAGYSESFREVRCPGCGSTWGVAVVVEYGSIYVKNESEMLCSNCRMYAKFWLQEVINDKSS